MAEWRAARAALAAARRARCASRRRCLRGSWRTRAAGSAEASPVGDSGFSEVSKAPLRGAVEDSDGSVFTIGAAPPVAGGWLIVTAAGRRPLRWQEIGYARRFHTSNASTARAAIPTSQDHIGAPRSTIGAGACAVGVVGCGESAGVAVGVGVIGAGVAGNRDGAASRLFASGTMPGALNGLADNRPSSSENTSRVARRSVSSTLSLGPTTQRVRSMAAIPSRADISSTWANVSDSLTPSTVTPFTSGSSSCLATRYSCPWLRNK